MPTPNTLSVENKTMPTPNKPDFYLYAQRFTKYNSNKLKRNFRIENEKFQLSHEQLTQVLNHSDNNKLPFGYYVLKHDFYIFENRKYKFDNLKILDAKKHFYQVDLSEVEKMFSSQIEIKDSSFAKMVNNIRKYSEDLESKNIQEANHKFDLSTKEGRAAFRTMLVNSPKTKFKESNTIEPSLMVVPKEESQNMSGPYEILNSTDSSLKEKFQTLNKWFLFFVKEKSFVELDSNNIVSMDYKKGMNAFFEYFGPITKCYPTDFIKKSKNLQGEEFFYYVPVIDLDNVNSLNENSEESEIMSPIEQKELVSDFAKDSSPAVDNKTILQYFFDIQEKYVKANADLLFSGMEFKKEEEKLTNKDTLIKVHSEYLKAKILSSYFQRLLNELDNQILTLSTEDLMQSFANFPPGPTLINCSVPPFYFITNKVPQSFTDAQQYVSGVPNAYHAWQTFLGNGCKKEMINYKSMENIKNPFFERVNKTKISDTFIKNDENQRELI